jgi:hypothetical protein
MKALFIFIVLLAPFAPAACNRATTQTPSSQAPAASSGAEVQPTPLELTGVELHKVRLSYPHKLREKDGKEKVYEQAWLVLFSFKNPPPTMDTRMDFYIGDYQVPEYGGSKNGIYFRIYEESLLRSLDEKEISVGVGGKKERSLGKKLSTKDYRKLSIEEESALLKR